MVLVEISLVFLIHFKDIGEDHGQAGTHLEVGGIHRDLNTARNVQIVDPALCVFPLLALIRLFRLGLFVVDLHLAGAVDDGLGFIAHSFQAVLQAGEGHADDHRVFAFRDHRSIVNLDIGRRIIGECHSGHSREGDIYILVLHIVGIVDVDLHLAALAGQILGRDLPAVQIIGDLLGYGRLAVGRSLIVNIVPVSIPDQALPVLVKSLVALDILDLLQGGIILEFSFLIGIFEPVGNCDIALSAVGIREDIYCFLLGSTGRNLSHRIRDGFFEGSALRTALVPAFFRLGTRRCLREYRHISGASADFRRI